MPHAALWVVQQDFIMEFVVDQNVSMPHAALWVVQRPTGLTESSSLSSFNAARGFVGGAAPMPNEPVRFSLSFNAARGFVGGAASSLAVLFPLGGKSSFGKSPEI